jgi:hypothetical protein
MWNCRSKLKLGGNIDFTRADGNVRAFCFRIRPVNPYPKWLRLSVGHLTLCALPL